MAGKRRRNKRRAKTSKLKGRTLKRSFPCLLLLGSVLIFGGCSNDSDQSSPSAKDPDWQRGRAVFIANCVACHNNDPSKDGAIGPAIKGSSRELIEARVLRNSYPTNYKPKRATKVMPQFPFLEPEIPYLAAYLRSESTQ